MDIRIIPPSYEILSDIDGPAILKRVERMGRISWKSEGKTTPTSAPRFVKMLIDAGHESVLEHETLSVIFTTDRGVTHEWVRHRVGVAYTQESTRYCDYEGVMTFIEPPFWASGSIEHQMWTSAMEDVAKTYLTLRAAGAKPQEARDVLPISLKAELGVTANLRAWRHVFKLRTDKAAHPQMRQVMQPLLDEFKSRIPVVFDDIP